MQLKLAGDGEESEVQVHLQTSKIVNKKASNKKVTNNKKASKHLPQPQPLKRS
jgi:hypothetical protein